MYVIAGPTRVPACLFVAGSVPAPVGPRPSRSHSRPAPSVRLSGRPVLGPYVRLTARAGRLSPLSPSIRAVIRYSLLPENAAFGKYGPSLVCSSGSVPSRAFRLPSRRPAFPARFPVCTLWPVSRPFVGVSALSPSNLLILFAGIVYSLYRRIESCIPRVPHFQLFSLYVKLLLPPVNLQYSPVLFSMLVILYARFKPYISRIYRINSI